MSGDDLDSSGRRREDLVELVEHALLAFAHPYSVKAEKAALLGRVGGLPRGVLEPVAVRLRVVWARLRGDDLVHRGELFEDLLARQGAPGLEAAQRSMARNLTGQVRNIADVATAIASGDLSKKITVNVSGEILLLKETVNTMVDQLNAFAGEVTRVAREVGTDGRLGGQANVPGVAGTWKDLTDNVNFMASNLTGQVRNIAEVTTAVARGDLSRKITVDVKGEILELKNTINTMVDQLNAFAGEVTRVAREVGTEGKLGRAGQRAGCGRHLEGPHRLGQLDGQ